MQNGSKFKISVVLKLRLTFRSTKLSLCNLSRKVNNRNLKFLWESASQISVISLQNYLLMDILIQNSLWLKVLLLKVSVWIQDGSRLRATTSQAHQWVQKDHVKRGCGHAHESITFNAFKGRSKLPCYTPVIGKNLSSLSFLIFYVSSHLSQWFLNKALQSEIGL